MPTVLRVKGYRFFFFSLEGHEPPHVHVEQAERYAKLWLEPVSIARAKGFRSSELRISFKSFKIIKSCSERDGMSSFAIKFEPLAVEVAFTDTMLRVVLADGREVSSPLAWFPRLLNATPEQRRNWQLIGGGIGIHWESVDEDISVESLLAVK